MVCLPAENLNPVTSCNRILKTIYVTNSTNDDKMYKSAITEHVGKYMECITCHIFVGLFFAKCAAMG